MDVVEVLPARRAVDGRGVAQLLRDALQPGQEEQREEREADTARLAAQRATPQEAQRIRETADRTVAAAAGDDFVGFFTADVAFHSAVAAAAHNIFLASVVDNLFSLMHRLKTAGIGEARDAMQRGAGEHADIAAAVLRGDPEGAEEAMRRHIDNSVEDYRTVVRERLFSRD